MALTIAIIDLKDGSHGNVVIAGLAPGVAWWLDCQKPNGRMVQIQGQNGNGTFPFEVEGPGVYWFSGRWAAGYTQVVVAEITDGSLPMAQQIAEQVASLINANVALPDSAIAKRAYVPGFTLEQLSTLQVTTVCRSIVSEIDTRGDDKEQYLVEIGVQRKLDYQSDENTLVDAANQAAACDPWAKLCQTIGDALADRENIRLPCGAEWTGDEAVPLYDYEVLDNERKFSALIAVTYQIFR